MPFEGMQLDGTQFDGLLFDRLSFGSLSFGSLLLDTLIFGDAIACDRGHPPPRSVPGYPLLFGVFEPVAGLGAQFAAPTIEDPHLNAMLAQGEIGR